MKNKIFIIVAGPVMLAVMLFLTNIDPDQETRKGDLMMATKLEANKSVVRQYTTSFNAGDMDGLRGLFADDAQVFGVLSWGHVDEVMPIWQQLVEALGIQLTIEDMVAEGDIVTVRFRENGIAKAPFFDKPATGKPYQLVAIEWFEIKNGKISRRWGARDAATQAKQLGWTVAVDKSDVKKPAMAE